MKVVLLPRGDENEERKQQYYFSNVYKACKIRLVQILLAMSEVHFVLYSGKTRPSCTLVVGWLLLEEAELQSAFRSSTTRYRMDGGFLRLRRVL